MSVQTAKVRAVLFEADALMQELVGHSEDAVPFCRTQGDNAQDGRGRRREAGSNHRNNSRGRGEWEERGREEGRPEDFGRVERERRRQRK